MNSTTTEPVKNKPSFNRGKAFKIFFGATAAAVILGLLYWFLISSHYEHTENAYVSAPQLQIVSQVEGTVSSVLIAETQSVKPGDLLIQIDTTEAKIASEMADADLVKAIRSVRSAISQAKQRQQEYERAKADYSRRASLKGPAAFSTEELSHAKTQLDVAEAAYKQAIENADGRLKPEEAKEHPDVLRAQAAAKRGFIALQRAEVKSPVNAIVARRTAQVGQRVSPGVPLATLIIGDSMWVDANFKEDQLAKMRIGQPAELKADIYGSRVTFKGKVSGFSPGTGSSLSLLPAQNATGNWVKVVQRLPVRIQIDAEQLKKNPLRVGLTMSVEVDTSKSEGLPLQSMEINEAIKTDLYDQQSALAIEHVNKIIKSATK
jgi:membrane fusion protein (multidrug efflux system)